ncbi:MAG: thiamine biosynthesis protein ThiS [Pseudooceanicola sp.]|jgi:sulfur carrier protein|nr:thiamine biosynthesis protein ThiS [Pseudooceanicola sp.]|tara:strand:- start:221 stop:418 length:198 start_codon:yes stop_codon:yes gene_type:complete
MRIDLNGAPVETAAATLADLIAERDLPEQSVATALDGQFIPRTARAQARLEPGARVEILSPMQGG